MVPTAPRATIARRVTGPDRARRVTRSELAGCSGTLATAPTAPRVTTARRVTAPDRAPRATVSVAVGSSSTPRRPTAHRVTGLPRATSAEPAQAATRRRRPGPARHSAIRASPAASIGTHRSHVSNVTPVTVAAPATSAAATATPPVRRARETDLSPGGRGRTRSHSRTASAGTMVESTKWGTMPLVALSDSKAIRQ